MDHNRERSVVYEKQKQTGKGKKRRAQRKLTVACFIAEGSFTIHVTASWITLHQAVILPANKTPNPITGVRFNWVRSMRWVNLYRRKEMCWREVGLTHVMYMNPRKNPVYMWSWMRMRMRMVWCRLSPTCLRCFFLQWKSDSNIRHFINCMERNYTLSQKVFLDCYSMVSKATFKKIKAQFWRWPKSRIPEIVCV